MIRFMADSWLEALLRPVSMALPLGGVYVETIAPDFRFVFALLLAAAWGFLLVRARRRPPAAAAALLAFCAASFVPWMISSGNGRYFMATLLLVGPLCIVLLHQMPFTRRARAAGAMLMLVTQGFLAHEVAPWGSWGLVAWNHPPAFAIDVPHDLARQPATYVTLNGISYSLIAPAFHPQSRWMSLASQQGRSGDPRDRQRVQQLLSESPVVYLLVPSLPGQAISNRHLPDEFGKALDSALLPHGLRLQPGHDCRLLLSLGLTSLGLRPGEPVPTSPDEQRGFWVCHADKVPAGAASSVPKIDPRVEAAFARVEQLCPRMFPPGSATSVVLHGAVRRFYVDSDMRLYVTDGGEVVYKYMRGMNAVTLGTTDQMAVPSFRLDCSAIRGRGLPWDREI